MSTAQHRSHLAETLDQWAELAAEFGFPREDPALVRAEARWRSGRYEIALLGEVKQGKSSFGNALLGAPGLLPTAEDIATSAAITASHGPAETWWVSFAPEGDLEPRTEPISRAELPAYATEAGNPANVRRVHSVQVEMPSPLLAQGLRLTDLPGLGGLIHEHAELVWRVLPSADVVLFIVAGREAPLTEAEVAMAKEAAAVTSRLVFVQTMADLAGGREQTQAFRSRNLQILSAARERPTDAIPYFVVSSKAKLEADRTGDAAALRRSGFGPLVEHLEREIVARKQADLGEGVAARLRELAHGRLRPALAERLQLTEAADAVELETIRGRMETASTELARFREGELRHVRERLTRALAEARASAERAIDENLNAPELVTEALHRFGVNGASGPDWPAAKAGEVQGAVLGGCAQVLEEVMGDYNKRVRSACEAAERALGQALEWNATLLVAADPASAQEAKIVVQGGPSRLVAASVGAAKGYGVGVLTSVGLTVMTFGVAAPLAPFVLACGAVMGVRRQLEARDNQRRASLAQFEAFLRTDTSTRLAYSRREMRKRMAGVVRDSVSMLDAAVDARERALEDALTEVRAARGRGDTERTQRRRALKEFERRIDALAGAGARYPE